MAKIIYKHETGKYGVIIKDFWRSRNAKGIDVEIYINGEYRYKPSRIFGPDEGITEKQAAIDAAYKHAQKVIEGKVDISKMDWEK